MMATQSLESFTIDVLDRFSAQGNQDRNWLISNEISKTLGGSSLTMGAICVTDSVPLWMRSTMGDDWLTEYVDQKHYQADKLTAHTKISSNPLIVAAGTETDRESIGWYNLNHALSDAGFKALYLTPFEGGNAGVRTAVTFNTALTPREMTDPIRLQKIRILSTFMVGYIGAPEPEAPASAGKVALRPRAVLSPRERETIIYIAQGFRNNQIAHIMNIAEVSVRKNIISVRRKLGATTREQAVAIAVKDGLISL